MTAAGVKIGGTLYGWAVLVAVAVGAYLVYQAYRSVAKVVEGAGEAIGTVKDGVVTVVTEPVQRSSAAEREVAGEPSSIYEDLGYGP